MSSRDTGWLYRRFLVLVGLMFWVGGFTFYAAVVVPVGQKVLTPVKQSFVTQVVTNYLNLSGAIVLAVFAAEVMLTRDPSAARRRWRWFCWLLMTIALVGLGWLHLRLDLLMNAENQEVLDRSALRPVHRIYLWVSTIQWAVSVAFTLLSLAAWRAEDSQEIRNDSEMMNDE